MSRTDSRRTSVAAGEVNESKNSEPDPCDQAEAMVRQLENCLAALHEDQLRELRGRITDKILAKRYVRIGQYQRAREVEDRSARYPAPDAPVETS